MKKTYPKFYTRPSVISGEPIFYRVLRKGAQPDFLVNSDWDLSSSHPTEAHLRKAKGAKRITRRSLPEGVK